MARPSSVPATRIDLSAPQLRADQAGYVVDGRSIDGFADDSQLTASARHRIAGWARTFGHPLDDAQRHLLALPAPTDEIGLQLLEAATRNVDIDLELAGQFGLYERLAPEELLLVREPWRGLGGDEPRDFPLTAGELAQLTGVTTKQVREWELASLLPGARIEGRRQFFSAAVVHAFALKGMSRFQVAALAALAAAEDDDGFCHLVEHTLAVRQRRMTGSASTVETLNRIKTRVRKLFERPNDEPEAAPAAERSIVDPAVYETFVHDALRQSSFFISALEAATSRYKAVDVSEEKGQMVLYAKMLTKSDSKPRSPLEIRLAEDGRAGAVFVHPSTDRGWTCSADLGFAVPRKDDAVKLGKMLGEQFGSNVHVVSKDEWTSRFASPGPERRHGK
jgi:DNA-binding transcriptional MerR regulator